MQKLFHWLILGLLLTGAGCSVSKQSTPTVRAITPDQTATNQTPEPLKTATPTLSPTSHTPTTRSSPFSSLKPEELDCLKTAWGEEAFNEITSLQRQPTAAEAPALFTCIALVTIEPTVDISAIAELNFIPDPGIRLDNASNPNVGIDPTGKVFLYYLDRLTNMEKLATAEDGLTFGEGVSPDTYSFDSRNILLPDGTWRRYIFNDATDEVTSMSSTDGAHFTDDDGVRYTLQVDDKGTMGVFDVFTTPVGNVVMLYLGDLNGLNNLRRAVSTDGGWTFIFDRGDILGDASLGGGANSFVDPYSIPLPSGRRRLFTMKQGAIYSFISDEPFSNFILEPGIRLSPEDFTEFEVTGLFDPKVILLPDGRYRMYVTAAIKTADGTERQAIVSATTPAP